LALLWAELPLVSAALVLYGGGMGIKSIVRGTMPLAVFGAKGYAPLMGRLAMPSLVAGAASPFVGAVSIEHLGANLTWAALTIMAAMNLVLVAFIHRVCRPRSAGRVWFFRA
jgi:hypothetical protein